MAQALRRLSRRLSKQEHEIHVFTNPLNDNNKKTSSSSRVTKSNSPKATSNLSDAYDYQAPLTALSLRPNSRWLIVRRNLHRIRFMGFSDNGKEGRLPDFYLGLQMTRELKRAQQEIKNVDKEEDFHVVKEFSLANEVGNTKKFDTSHVKPDDALIYDRLGEEPLALQNLLYYFSKQDVPHGTVFWNFLNEVNQVLNLKRKRTVLVQRLRRLALTLAIILYSFIGLMIALMIISVIITTTKMNDPEVEWMDQRIGGYSSDIVSIK
jgi:hypothetical protein